MPTNLPSDPEVMEQTLAGAIRDTLLSVPIIAQYAKVEARERFPDNEKEDIELTTVPDLGSPEDLRFTSIIQIGIPTVEESIYTDDNSTKLRFIYPITIDMDVVDEWPNQDSQLVYTNSRVLFMAMYMNARKAFKTTPNNKPNRDLGFQNCVHDYLQQESVGTVQQEKTGKLLHAGDWSLTITVMGVLN